MIEADKLCTYIIMLYTVGAYKLCITIDCFVTAVHVQVPVTSIRGPCI